KHLTVASVHQLVVGVLAMSGIEGVVTNHCQTFFRQVILDDLVQILVMAPGEMHAVETTTLLIDAARALIERNLAVRIIRKKLGENDLLRKSAPHRERIANHRPLGLAEQAEHLTKIMDQTRQDKPARLASATNGFGHLHEVLDLTK